MLVSKYGFRIHSRVHGISFIMEKIFTDVRKPDPLETHDLSKEDKEKLIRSCERIVSWYNKPENHVLEIRNRLYVIALLKPEPEKKFIQDWCEINYPKLQLKALN